MPDSILTKLGQLLGRELSQEEKERFLRCKEILQVSDNDAIWNLLAAMEYQRTYYDALPAKIEETTQRLLKGIASGSAQAPQWQCKPEKGNKELVNMRLWFPWAVGAFAVIIIYGALNMWVGYCFGSGTVHPPALLLKMPVGIVLGITSLCLGGIMAVKIGKCFSSGQKLHKQEIVVTLLGLILGMIICVLTLAI